MNKMDRIKIDDLRLRPEVFSLRLQRRAKLRDLLNQQMPAINKAVESFELDEYYDRALSLIVFRAAHAKPLIWPAKKTKLATFTVATRSGKAA